VASARIRLGVVEQVSLLRQNTTEVEVDIGHEAKGEDGSQALVGCEDLGPCSPSSGIRLPLLDLRVFLAVPSLLAGQDRSRVVGRETAQPKRSRCQSHRGGLTQCSDDQEHEPLPHLLCSTGVPKG
jgi:hypothetical protein